MGISDIRLLVDALLEQEKFIAGGLDWQNGPRDGQRRLSAALSADGEIGDIRLVVDAYPDWFEPKFTISLILARTVCRLDYGNNASHVNRPPAPDGIELGLITGPHFHAWRDNRHLATQKHLPEESKFASLLPANVKGFQNAFRWFCGEVNVNCSAGVPEFPKSDRLL